ncbi:hypothetical protein Tco_0731254 [Tanacetum coccineum]
MTRIRCFAQCLMSNLICSPSVVQPALVIAAQEPVASTGTPSSMTIDQDAPSTSTSQTTQESQSQVIPSGVEEGYHDIEVSHMEYDLQNWMDLPRDNPLVSVEVLRYDIKGSKSKNKGIVPTEMELVLEQTQQDGNPARANIKQALVAILLVRGSNTLSWKPCQGGSYNESTGSQEAIQYPRFIKLIVADLMKKFPNIPKRLEEDYHSIKDDVPLVDVPMNQPQPVVSTQGTNRNTPRAPRTPTVSASPQETKKRKQAAGESSSPRKSLKITIKQKQLVEKDDDDSEDRIEPGSHKDNPEVVDDDDDNEREKKGDELGSLEVRNEETQTTIPTPLSSPRKILSSDKKTFQELTDIVSNPTTSTSKHSQVKKRISSKYSHLPGALHRMCRRQDRADDIALWEALRRKFENSSTSNTSCREDDFHSHHDEHQDDDAPPEGEKRIKRSKTSKRSKSARDSSSKHSRKDSTTYVSKQQSQHQELDAWEEENVVDEDEVISEDVTPELIAEF